MKTTTGTDEEIFLWIGVSIILLIGVFLFKSKNEQSRKIHNEIYIILDSIICYLWNINGGLGGYL